MRGAKLSQEQGCQVSQSSGSGDGAVFSRKRVVRQAAFGQRPLSSQAMNAGVLAAR